MALPFVLGIALGATAVVAYNKSDKIKSIISSGIDKTKENVEDFKEKIDATKDCIKSKSEEKTKNKKDDDIDESSSN